MDAKTTAAPAERKTAPERSQPSHIKLAADWREYRAGRVLAVTAELLSSLDVAGVAYTEATSRECGIAGFAD